MIIHSLKVWSIYYDHLYEHYKSFEIRYDDRHFKVGDILELKEYFPNSESYSGNVIYRRIAYIMRPSSINGLKDGYVAMSIEPYDPSQPKPHTTTSSKRDVQQDSTD